MNCNRFFALVCRLAVTSALALASTVCVAGNIKLTIAGYATPIDVQSFSMGAQRNTTTSYNDLTTTSIESAAMPFALQKLSTGFHNATVLLQVYSPTTGLLSSDWLLTDVVFSSFTISSASTSASSSNGLPMTTINARPVSITYRFYAADGTTVLQRSCWNVNTSTIC